MARGDDAQRGRGGEPLARGPYGSRDGLLVHGVADRLGCDLGARAVQGDLDAAGCFHAREARHAVDGGFRAPVEEPHGHPGPGQSGIAAIVEPRDGLAGRAKRRHPSPEQAGHPRPGRQDERVGLEALPVALHPRSARAGAPGRNRRTSPDLCPVTGGVGKRRGDGPLGPHEAAPRLEDAFPVRRHPEHGESPHELPAVERFDVESVLARASQHARGGGVACRTADDQTRLVAQRFARVPRHAVEQLVGAPEQRDVVGVLEVRETDHTASAVRGAEVVGWREAVEAEWPEAPTR